MKRPVIPVGGTLGFLFKVILDRLDRLEGLRSPGILTSITTKGIVRRPLAKGKSTTTNSSAPVWL